MEHLTDKTETLVSEPEVGTLSLLGAEGANALDRAAIDVQIATAKRFPRSVAKALREARELACENEAIAETMFYVLPKRDKDGKKIQGPSARLAEIMLFCWGNARGEADVVSEDGRFVTAMGTAFDLERNVAIRVRARRRITDSKGKKYSEDMIQQTSNAAMSIALRNAILRLIPRAFTEPIYKAAQLASVGKGTIEQKRTAALDYFAKQGYAPEAVYEFLGVKGLQDVGVDEIILLRGIINAVKEGETTLEETFNPQPAQSEEAARLDEALAGGATTKTEGESPTGQVPSPSAGAVGGARSADPEPAGPKGKK